MAGDVGAHAGRSMRFGEQFDTILPAAQNGEVWAFDILYRHFAAAVTGYLRLQQAVAKSLPGMHDYAIRYAGS